MTDMIEYATVSQWLGFFGLITVVASLLILVAFYIKKGRRRKSMSGKRIPHDPKQTKPSRSEYRIKPQDVEDKPSGSSFRGATQDSKSTSRESGHGTSGSSFNNSTSERSNVENQGHSDKSNVSKGPYVGAHSIFEPRSTRELKRDENF
ncbi:MAG: hypothetical protein MHMPM18_000130 [Marteilia pararefringens]